MASNLIGGSSYNDASCASRQPEVHGWLQSLEFSAKRLMENAVDLDARLAQVLGPQEPANACDKQAQAGCSLASSIQLNVATLNNVEYILSSILRRLEI